MTEGGISDTRGNSPLKHVPHDYYPGGCGFWYTLPEGRDAGKKLFFRDSTHGSGAPKATIVFVHGNPECSYAYRCVVSHMQKEAGNPFRVIAMDHIGFGLSDQASYEMVAMDHAENLLQLVRHLDLRDVTLVIHDWGGPIGIGAFIHEPQRMANLVVLNTTVFPMPPQGKTYKNYPIRFLPWSFYPNLYPNALWGSFSTYAIFRTPAGAARIIAGAIAYPLLSELGIYPGRDKTACIVYKEQFGSKANARSSKRLVRMTPCWGHGVSYREPRLGTRDTGPFYRFIQENITRLWGPEGRNIGASMVVGRWDPLGKDEVIDQWARHLPQLAGHVQIHEDVGHFVEEARPRDVALAILETCGV